jgi:hypothetical protein
VTDHHAATTASDLRLENAREPRQRAVAERRRSAAAMAATKPAEQHPQRRAAHADDHRQ